MLRKTLAGLALLLIAATMGTVAFGQATQNHALPGNLRLSSGTATATAGAATLNNKAGKVTSESLSTAAAAAYTLTVTNSTVAATDVCFASVAYGTSSAGVPMVSRVTPGSSSLVIVVTNEHASNAFNGTIVVSFLCTK